MTGRDAGSFAEGPGAPLTRALDSIRKHLGMDVAFIAEFRGGAKIFRLVSAERGRRTPALRAGLSTPIDQGYCKKVIDGALPAFIRDASALPAALAIPETAALPVGSHLSVPLFFDNGDLYGVLCCFSHAPNRLLHERDIVLLRAFADVIAGQIEAQAAAERAHADQRERISAVIRAKEPAMVYQPIFKVFDMTMAGAEALARFSAEPRRTPDVWFAEAETVGMRVALERHAIRNAIEGFRSVWKEGPIDLTLNCSPGTIVAGNLETVLRRAPIQRLILEITEHDHVEDYAPLLAEIGRLRQIGVRIAVDDAGSGYASMRHIIHMAPDYIKLDISLTRGIERDRMKQALASSLIEFGRQTACKIVAEGIETASELITLRNLGVDKAQGYFLSRPIPAADVADLAARRVIPAAENLAWEDGEVEPEPDSLCA